MGGMSLYVFITPRWFSFLWGVVVGFFSEADGVLSQPEKFDTAWVRKLALNFEKRISKNAEMRAKYENDPQKCVNIPS